MLIKKSEFQEGYNVLTEQDGQNKIAEMDFGILTMKKGSTYNSDSNKEYAFLLIEGCITYKWEGFEEKVIRRDMIDEMPFCLSVSKGTAVTISSESDSEIAVFSIINDTLFEPRLYRPEDCLIETLGKDVMDDTSLRQCRTIIEDSSAPHSNLVIGEIINYPGRWSSYPPHHHIQPEIYYYRFSPKMGFGFSQDGDEITMVKDRDAVILRSGLVHSQVSAPGYVMYYIWTIPHTKDGRWRRDREYIEPHRWLLDKDAKIWPK